MPAHSCLKAVLVAALGCCASGAEGRRASAPLVSRQVLNHPPTRPRIEGHLLEGYRRFLLQSASDVVRSQFLKFCTARGNAGVLNVDLTCTSKKAFSAPERSDWFSRETKTSHCKRISAAARGGHCGARVARAGAEAKNFGLENTQSAE